MNAHGPEIFHKIVDGSIIYHLVLHMSPCLSGCLSICLLSIFAYAYMCRLNESFGSKGQFTFITARRHTFLFQEKMLASGMSV
jgi:hypothetical protein